jgi:hypothetical protein
MRFHGSRRVKVISLGTVLVLGLFLWRAVSHYYAHALERLAPTLVAQLEQRLGRRVAYDRLETARPGRLVVHGLRVSRGPTWAAGRLVTVRRAEVRFNPLLTAWQTYFRETRLADARATLTADGIEVYRPLPFPEGRALTADSVEADFDLAPLLAGGKDPLPGIRTVTIRGPRFALTRLPDRTWDLERLLRAGQKKPTTFRGLIRAFGARVAVTDFVPGSLPAPAGNAVAGDLTLSYAAYPLVGFTGAGSVLGPRGGRFQLTGHREARSRRWYVSGEGDTAALPYWYRYAVRRPGRTEVHAGAGRIRAIAWDDRKDHDLRPDFRATVEVTGGGGRVAGIPEPFSGYEGRVVVEPDWVEAEGRVRVAGMPVRVAGRQAISPEGVADEEDKVRAPSRGEWRAESAAATLSGLQAVFPRLTIPEALRVARPLRISATAVAGGGGWRVRGQVNARSVKYARVTAPAVDAAFTAQLAGEAPPRVTGEFRIPRARLPDLQVTDGTGTFHTTDEIVRARARFAALGGGVALSAWLAPRDKEPRFWLEGEATGLDLARAPWRREGWPARGKFAAAFTASGTAEDPEVTADLTAPRIEVRDAALTNVAARVRWAPGALTIEAAQAADDRGVLRAFGEVALEPARLALTVEGDNLDLAAWLKGRVKEPVAGEGVVRMTVTGTPDDLVLVGQAQVYQPRWREHAADYAEARFRTDGADVVQVSEAKLIRHPAVATSAGLEFTRPPEAPAETPWRVAGRVEVQGLAVNQALALNGEGLGELPALAGEVESLTLDLSGDPGALQVAWQGRVVDAAARRLDLGSVSANGAWEQATGRLTVAEAVVHSPLGEVRGFGAATPATDGPAETRWRRAALSAGGRVTGVPLTRAFRDAAPDNAWNAEIAGIAGGEFALTRVGADLDLHLRGITVTDLRLAGVPATLAPLDARIVGDAVLVRGVRLTAESGALSLPWAVYRPAAAAGTPREARWAVGPLKVEALPLRVALAAADRVPLAQPDAERYDRLRDSLDRWVSWSEAVVSGSLGPADAGAPSDAQLLARLDAPAAADLRGDLQAVGFTLETGTRSPARLEAQFTLAPDHQDLRALTLTTADGARVDAFGVRRNPAGKDPGLQFAGTLRGFDLAALTSLPDADWGEKLRALQPLRGRVEAGFGVAGSEAKPEVTFQGRVVEPVVAGVPLDLIECREGSYSAAQGRLAFKELRLEARGARETAQVSAAGYWPLQWPDLTTPATAPRSLTITLPAQSLDTLTDLAARSQSLTGGIGSEAASTREWLTGFFGALVVTNGSVAGEVRLGGTAALPDNAGSFSLTSDLIRIRARPEFRPRERWFAARSEPRPQPGPELLETGVKDFRLRVDLAGNALRVAELRGAGTYGGAFSGSGTLTLGAEGQSATAPRAALSLAIDGFRLVEGNAARLLGEAFQNTELRATFQSADPAEPTAARALRLTGAWPNLTLTGGLRVEQAVLPLAFDSSEAGALAALPDIGELKVTLLAGKAVWVRNSLIRLQIEPTVVTAGRTDGALQITNRLNTPIVAGTLRAGGGTFNLPLLRLRNVEGSIRVAYDGRSAQLAPNPATPVYLDLTGETSLRIQRSPVLEAEYYDATFEIRGVPGAGGTAGFRPTGADTALAIGAEGGLTVTVRTDPPLPSSEIEALIRQQYAAEGFGTGGANVVEALRGQIEQAFAVNVASEFTGRVEDALRSALGLSIFSVEFGVSQPLRLRLGKRLFGPVYGTVAQSFGATELQTQRRFEVYYRVSPQFRVGYREEEPLGRKVFFFSGTAAF